MQIFSSVHYMTIFEPLIVCFEAFCRDGSKKRVALRATYFKYKTHMQNLETFWYISA